MDEKIDQAIERMADLAKVQQDPTKAQQFSQAALNLAHTKQVLEGKSPRKQGAGA